MGRLVAFLLGLGALIYAAQVYLKGHPLTPSTTTAPSAPKRVINQARDTAHQIEQDTQRRADEMLEKTR
jgi:hypothetical protein